MDQIPDFKSGHRGNSYLYAFEKSAAWQRSRTLVKYVYLETNNFPSKERYGIISQLQRAVVSVPTNLSEGSARKSFKEKAHYTEMAYGSLMEVMNLLYIAHDLNYLSDHALSGLRDEISEVSIRITGLYKYQRDRDLRPPLTP